MDHPQPCFIENSCAFSFTAADKFRMWSACSSEVDFLKYAHLAHRLPNRLRYNVRGLYRSAELASELAAHLQGHPEIVTIDCRLSTGSLILKVTSDSLATSITRTIEMAMREIIDEHLHALPKEKPAQKRSQRGTHRTKQSEQSLELLRQELPQSLSGLSDATVRLRRQQFGINQLQEPSVVSTSELWAQQFTNIPTAVLGVSAIASLATGGIADAVLIGGVVLVNAVMGYRTELEATKIIASLSKYQNGTCVAVRNGQPISIDGRELVPGDLVLLTPGPVPADIVLLSAESLSVDESSLTGESEPVQKFGWQDASQTPSHKQILFGGTNIVGGHAKGVVWRIGGQTELGSIQTLVSETKTPETPLQRDLRLVGHQLVMAAIFISGGVFVAGILRGRGALNMLKTSLTLGVAAVPEGLPAIGTMTMANAVKRMQRHRAYVRRMDAVETLGSVDILCLDKTGTLTCNRMRAVTAYVGLRSLNIRDGQVYEGEASVSIDNDMATKRLAEALVLCSDVRRNRASASDSPTWEGSPTEVALVEFALELGLNRSELRRRWPRDSATARTEQQMYMISTHRNHADTSRIRRFVKGSPGQVLAMCDEFWENGKRSPLSPSLIAAISAKNEHLASQGLRVLGVAVQEDSSTESGWQWIGIVGLTDPPREGVASLLNKFHQAGVRTKMITGDQVLTASAVAGSLGIGGSSAPNVVDFRRLRGMSREELAKVAIDVDVFARVSPSDKLHIVRALQFSGHVVAMTGDGLNDGPALKAADIGIAMGAAGSDVARQTADMVLADDNLETILVAIQHGRSLRTNLRDAVRFLASTNLSEVLMMFGSIAAGVGEPLNPKQLLWLNLVTDIFPAMALALRPTRTDEVTQPMSAVRLFDVRDYRRTFMEAGVLAGVSLFAGIGQHQSTPANGTSSAGSQGVASSDRTFASLMLSQIAHMYVVSQSTPGSSQHATRGPGIQDAAALAGAGLSSAAFLVPQLRSLLQMGTFGAKDAAIALGAAGSTFAVNKMIQRAHGGAHSKIERGGLHV